MKIAVITDSGCNLSQDFINQQPNLTVIPLMIQVDGKSYRDQKDITAAEIYAVMDDYTISTSLPELGDFKQAIMEIKDSGYEAVIIINISSSLSGTYNAFRLELEQVKGLKVIHIDSKTLAGHQGYLVEEALALIKEEASLEFIKEALERLRYETSLAFYTINTLKYLKKGGRIGKVEGTIGDLLNIKPIITVDDQGAYVTHAKAFGMKRALIHMKNSLIEKFGDEPIDLTIHYGLDLEKAQQLGDSLCKVLNVRELTVSELTPVLGIHTGPDMFAMIAKLV